MANQAVPPELEDRKLEAHRVAESAKNLEFEESLRAAYRATESAERAARREAAVLAERHVRHAMRKHACHAVLPKPSHLYGQNNINARNAVAFTAFRALQSLLEFERRSDQEQDDTLSAGNTKYRDADDAGKATILAAARRDSGLGVRRVLYQLKLEREGDCACARKGKRAASPATPDAKRAPPAAE